jgi:hypothetical protein
MRFGVNRDYVLKRHRLGSVMRMQCDEDAVFSNVIQNNSNLQSCNHEA